MRKEAKNVIFISLGSKMFQYEEKKKVNEVKELKNVIQKS
jgi:hypothetical protein